MGKKKKRGAPPRVSGECQECGVDYPDLIKYKGKWICRICLNPNDTPLIQEQMRHKSSVADFDLWT